MHLNSTIHYSLTTFKKADARQPSLLCSGEQKKTIKRFFITVDQRAFPSEAQTSVAAFDGLFKAHYSFSLSYSTMKLFAVSMLSCKPRCTTVMLGMQRYKELRA